MMRVWWAVLLACVGCSLGPRVKSDTVAQGPRGVVVRVNTTFRALTGELLAIDDSAVTVLVESQVWRAPYASVRRITARGQGTIQVEGRALPEARRERLRLRSRFPQGIDAELLTALLAAYRQDSVLVAWP